jgi:transketolase
MTGESGGTAGRANLEVFAETVQELAAADSSLLVVTSDSRGSAKLSSFASRMPERMIEVGIAEQNLVGVAAGLAAGGRRVMAVSPASFLVTRSLEQIKHDVCYSDRPVILVGISAGVSYGALGSTHHSLHDFAALRAVNNITVAAPADNWETREALRAALGAGSPVYLRFGKKPLPDLPARGGFSFGKGRIVREGGDCAFIATGETVWRALAAAQALSEAGISTAVASMHTVKPLDAELVRVLGRSVGAVVAVEEHSEHGGLGDACARVLLEAGLAPRYRVMAIPDEYTVTGSQEEILSHYGISSTGLSRVMSELLREG